MNDDMILNKETPLTTLSQMFEEKVIKSLIWLQLITDD